MENNKIGRWTTFGFPLSLAILFYCIGDVLLKIGNIEIGSDITNIFQGLFWIAFLSNMPIITSFILAIISKLLMGKVLSKNPLGITEGIFLAFTALMTFFLGVFIFQEKISLIDLVAISLIALGILLVYNFDSNSIKSNTKENDAVN